MRTVPERQFSLDDYHRIEEVSPIRHEFFAGEIFAMAGGSVVHNQVCANLLTTLRTALAATACSTLGSDMRLLTPAGLLTYPDVMVICGTIDLVPERQDEVTNPVLLVEVLSDATRRYDRGEKLIFYKAIPALAEVLLVEPDRPAVEIHRRQADGTWVVVTHTSLDDSVSLPSINVSMPMRTIYHRTELVPGPVT